VTLQSYLALIACIMILSLIGKLPTKRTYDKISFYFLGCALLEELEAHIKKLKVKED
jgi:hypothetical protein